MRCMASMSAGVITDMVCRIQQAGVGALGFSLNRPECSSRRPARPRPPSRHKGAGGRSSWRSELVLGCEVELATLNRPGKEHIAEAGRRTELACIAFREADLVGQVRALDAQLPVLLEGGDETGPEHVVGAEGLPAHNVLVALADVLVSHPSSHVSPGERLDVARCEPDLELRLALQRCPVGRGARNQVTEDVSVL